VTPPVVENKCRKPQPEKFWFLARLKMGAKRVIELEDQSSSIQ
jgi:hypothetical protein